MLGVVLSFCFHGPLVAAGFYRFSWDASTHIFFADHYRRSWFALWDPRWFGGVSVSSYPPLVHQLIALLSFPFGYDRAFAILLLSVLVVFPVAAWRFALVFVAPAAARYAAIVAAFVPGVALAAHSYGQLPTLMSVTVTLFLAFEFTRFVERGGGLRLGLVGALAGPAFAAHHATPMFFLPPALLAGLSTVIIGVDKGALAGRLRRAGIAAACAVVAGAFVIAPFWLWAIAGIHEAFIPHGSRANFLADSGAQARFLWGVYGVLPALAIVGLRIRADRRTLALAILAGCMAILGLGGTTPIPSLVFGRQWEWLTYDRFALWGAVALVPLAGIAVHHLLSVHAAAARALATGALVVLMAYAGFGTGVSFLGPDLRPQPDVRPIAAFMNNGRPQWRYQPFGVGNAATQLGYLAAAATIDGAYYSARRVPELAPSGIGMLDAALLSDPSGAVLRRVLARANAYGIRWAFVLDPRYDPYLSAAGFARNGSLAGGVKVWENPTAPPVPAAALRFGVPDFEGILWGTLPLASLFVALVFAAAQSLAGVLDEDRSRRSFSTPSRLRPQPVGNP